MILHAGNGLVLTQSADIPMKQRIFRTHVNLRDSSEIADWKEITEKQKEQMLADAAIIDMDDMTVESIKRVDSIIKNVKTRINEVPMTIEQSLELVGYFPKWEEGKEMPIGYKVSYEGSLFEVLQAHTSQTDWTPREAKSLFKIVQVESEGTEYDVIQWEQGMVLEDGKFYIDNGVKYKCIRDSGNPLYYSLDVLVGNYVEIVEE
jgi:hypothetical protein